MPQINKNKILYPDLSYKIYGYALRFIMIQEDLEAKNLMPMPQRML